MWRRSKLIVGNALALAVLFVACLIFGGSEYVEAIRFRHWCQSANLPCAKSSDFVRLSAFAFIAMAQAMVLFVIGGVRERKSARAHNESRWR